MVLGLFKYFKVLKDPPLPDPNGSLSNVVDRCNVALFHTESTQSLLPLERNTRKSACKQ